MARKPPARRARRTPVDRATAYARAVATGKVIAGRPVRLACERHLRDMRQQKARGLDWRRELSEQAVDFFSDVLVLETGAPFHLQPFQAFIVGSLFGWYRADGYRRFRSGYVETGKGSGKTPLAGGIGLYGLVADSEAAAEVYSAATTQDQARIVWNDADRMVSQNPELAEVVKREAACLSYGSPERVFRPVSSEHKGLDGKRVHVGLIDELHEHPTAMVVDKIRAGTKNRRNALIFEITNSGYDRRSVCWAHHEYSLKVLEGVADNDAWFAYVCALDLCDKCRSAGTRANDCRKCDDWRDERVWMKANPGLDTILQRTYLREQVEEAKGMPSKENIVRRLNFCEWTEQFERWLSMEDWDACSEAPDLESLKGAECVAGLDMASRDDFAAQIKLWGPDEEGFLDVTARFWLPAESLSPGKSKRAERDRLMLLQWAREGWITLTEGETTDYDLVEEALLQDFTDYRIKEIAVDQHDITQLIQHLQDAVGLDRVLGISQSMASMSAPSKELEKVVRDRKLRHGGNPVLRWMASNVTIKHGPNQQVKPDKDRSAEKIDGITALVMAFGRAMVRPQPVEQDTAFEWLV